MAFKTNSLSQVYLEAQNNLRRLKIYLNARLFYINSEPTSSKTIFEILDNLKQARTFMDVAANTPGIAEYAQNEQNDVNYDVVVEYNNLRNAISTTIEWVILNYPKDVSGIYVLAEEMDAQGNRVPRYFLLADLGTFPTLLQDIVDLID